MMLLGASVTGCVPGAFLPGSGGNGGGADTPPPAKACTPDASAAQLPSAVQGGINLPALAVDGTPDRPRFGYLEIRQIETWEGGGHLLTPLYATRGGGMTVDTGAFTLGGDLVPAPSGWYASHLQLTGVKPDSEQYPPAGMESGGFNLFIPAGQTGEAFQLLLRDVLRGDGTTGDVAFAFCRQPAPRVTAAFKDGDAWRPATASVSTGGPLVLRLAFTSDMLASTVERALRGPHDKDGGSMGDWITALKWIDSRTVELTAAKPAPVMRLNLEGAQDKYGLFVAGGAPTLYAGEAPTVMAVDLASGEQRRLAELPLEPAGATLSVDGRWLRNTSQSIRGGYSATQWQQQLIDLTTGKAQLLKPADMSGYWLPSGEVLTIMPDSERKSLVMTRQSVAGKVETTTLADVPSYDTYVGSPDGKFVAVLAHSGAQLAYPYVGARFLIISSDGKERRPLTGAVQLYRPGQDGGLFHEAVWSPDGTRLALTQPTKDGVSLLVADRAAGTVRTIAESVPASDGIATPLTWSPDGSKILVGRALIDSATGKVVQQIAALTSYKPRWSKDGDWLLFQTELWGEVTAYHLPTGKGTSLGAGLPLGWNADGKALLIRWPGSAYRTITGP
ncbi:MAG: hypothetical protein JWN15_594 [Firmicutes bacterium]|nr:hypothetical protein [Bacillota bacterium]